MRGLILAPGLCLLAACALPPPEFRGVAPVRVMAGQSVFDVRVASRRAQAVRLTPEWAPRPDAVAPRALAAMQAVSGCRVVRLSGDAAVSEGALDCGAGPPPRPPVPVYLDCDFHALGEDHAALDCYLRG